MGSIINIEGIDKVTLLKELWSKQIVASFFITNDLPPPPFDEVLATKAVKKFIDYFCGRAIKSNLSKDEVDTTNYNRDAGEGVFEDIVKKLRN